MIRLQSHIVAKAPAITAAMPKKSDKFNVKPDKSMKSTPFQP
jgi:hypothetical protein